MARGGRRGGRASGRAGGGSMPSMADWIDANLPATRFAKLASLVQAHKASAMVAAIVKKFQEMPTPLSKVLRGILEKELDGAGEWSSAAAPAATTRSTAAPASTAKGPATRVASASRGRAVTAPAPVETPRLRRRARRAASAMASAEASNAEVGTSHAGEADKDAAKEWICQECTTPHLQGGQLCKVCKAKRFMAAEVMATPAAESAESVAARAAELQVAIDAMMTVKTKSATTRAAIDEMKGQIALLLKPSAPAPQLSRNALIQNAADAMEATQKRVSVLEVLAKHNQAKIDQFSATGVSLEQALALAASAQLAAEASYEAVVLASTATAPLPGSGAEPAVHATPAPAAAYAVIAQQLETLSAPDAEANIRDCMDRYAVSWGCNLQQEFPMARFMAELISNGPLALAAAQSAAAQPPRMAAGAAAPATAKGLAAKATTATPAAGAVGGELLRPRVPLQVESRAKPSAAQTAMHAHGEAQRGVGRKTALAAGRQGPEAGEAENKAESETEDSGDLSGDGATS